ncbi:DUF4919 domain-containing protein [Telluribacter sp.]|jgi:hypothetical protein|uniref:DUF4919 domain-containing protein n=1 Tax=Telluribacter sp. TaxID=1978767 RepID=UPI002E142A6C|nr:DUF4919 domain-containing protein [Telluribacter sp.]
MIKKSFLLFIISTLFAHSLFGQIQIDLNKIKELTRDSASAYYYKTLETEFIHYPESITMERALFLYYGRLYSANYKLFYTTAEESHFLRALKSKNIIKAAQIGETIIAGDPANLSALYQLAGCYKKAGNEVRTNHLITRVNILLETILESGSGKTADDACKVVSIGDQYAIMSILGYNGAFKGSSQKGKTGTSMIEIWEYKDPKTKSTSKFYFDLLMNVEDGLKHIKYPD